MTDFSIKSGGTAPVLSADLLDDEQPVNLTGATVLFRMRARHGGPLLVNGPAVVDDAVNGTVHYDWQPGDTDEVGMYDVEWVVTFAGGQQEVFPADGYTTVTVLPSLQTEIATPVAPFDVCWPIDLGCCSTFDEYSDEVQERAQALAGQTMRMLTGYQIGGCGVTVRPCRRDCVPVSFTSYSSFTMPYIDNGTWLNMVCGSCAGDCSCSTLSEIILPLPVGRIDEVKVDGVVLVKDVDYRLDGGGSLVRLGGEQWPTCQDMMLADTEVGTMSVTYLNAEPVDGIGAYAAGILACEFAKACSGAKCRLPSGVTEITRQGVSMTIAAGIFSDGLTGVREVDAYILAHNPYLQKTPSTVWSPDQTRFRSTLAGY